MSDQIKELSEFFRLLLGTVIYRPYVYCFFVCFLFFCIHQFGKKNTILYTILAWLIAFAAEYSSTHNGFPFGPYDYYDETRTRELWVLNVPFWDSLSFVFLSYFSFVLAAALLSARNEVTTLANWSGLKHRATPVLGGFLMMLLDVVIDPLTLQGDKWFLGKIYSYPYEGFHFGVTAANYAGWFFVGVVSQTLFQKFFAVPVRFRFIPRFIWGVFGVYAGVFGFMFCMTLYIQDYKLAVCSALVIIGTLVPVGMRLKYLDKAMH